MMVISSCTARNQDIICIFTVTRKPMPRSGLEKKAKQNKTNLQASKLPRCLKQELHYTAGKFAC